MELLSGKISTLISDREVLWAPAFSPDGKEIAYSRSETDGAWHIWIVSASGGTPEQFTRGKASEVYPRYAPGGQTILFHTWGAEKPAIWRALRNGSPPAQLKFTGASSDSYADISKDGRWIAFARVENEASHVYISPMDGSAPPRRLTEGPSAVPRWSPDGKWITFSADRDFFNGIWLVRSDGTELRRLTDTGGWPVWWPDGTQIGFQGIGANQNEEIRIFSLKTGKVTVLRGLDFDGINFPFDLSPDGKRLVSTNSVHDTDEIWLLEPPKK
jgi:TolB protein